ASMGALWSLDLAWGIKYGIGSSTLHGNDRDYEINYDSECYPSHTDYGRLTVRSQKAKDGFSQNAGLYASTKLLKKTDSLGLRAELLWHRHVFNAQFNDAPISTGSVYLTENYAGNVSGRVEHTADYLSLPILISLNQELTEEQINKSFQGANVYLGPSFSFLMDQSRSSFGGVHALETALETPYTVPGSIVTYYENQRVSNGTDELQSLKTDFVLGAGFTLKDIFGFGLGKDVFDFDFRFNLGLNELGDSGYRDAVTLRSIMFSVGARL
ncbi:MAG TPA: hypothetical protein PLX77_04490, partial [Candidatus Cloacimonadota bacterium]|nr:hypothetical protein [Candidatus Cloacimonadota bacterium]